MLERLTDGSLRAYVDARAFARTSRHDSIDAAHLLVGILRSPDTTGGGLLGRAGLRYDPVRIVVEQSYPRSEDLPSGRIALTAEARTLLELASRRSAPSAGARRLIWTSRRCSAARRLPRPTPCACAERR